VTVDVAPLEIESLKKSFNRRNVHAR
jgi:hypothetical protein